MMRTGMLLFLVCGLLQAGVCQLPAARHYATQQTNARSRITDPAIAGRQSQIEQFIASQGPKIKFKPVTIPLVFHIVYTPGKPFPSQEQVLSQIEALNRDFSKKAYQIRHPADTLEGFSAKAEDTQIDFCLARTGPNEEASAIRLIPSGRPTWSDDDAIKSQANGGADPWDSDKYLNVWVANLSDQVAGYAQMPGGPAATDGIVIDYRFLGVMGTALAPYHQGKTLTHLVGSYLGLYELWNAVDPCGDDYVEDTPIHNAPNYGMPIYKHVSTCHDNAVEMTMNFMDNSDDEATYMFTAGQKARMQAMLSEGGPRAGLAAAKTKCDRQNQQLLALAPESRSPVQEGIPTMSLYPNPTSQAFILEVNNTSPGRLNVVAYSALGAIVYVQEQSIGSGLTQLSIESHSWPAGLYFLHVSVNDFKLAQRLVISRR